MQTIVGVLRGGLSREHEASLKSGAAILAHLPKEKFDARDIYIDTTGQWHDRGRPVSPERVLRQIDAAIFPLHGEYGESGDVHRLLESFSVPYVGADALATHHARHKVIAKMRAIEQGILTPLFRHVEKIEESEHIAQDVIRAFEQPVVVKPIGISVEVSIVGGYALVLRAIQDLFAQGALSVLVEERIRGKSASAGVVEGLRGESWYTPPTIEVVNSRHVCPGNFSRVETEELKRAARLMHRTLGQRHYSHSDFVVGPKGVYYLGTDSAVSINLSPRSQLPLSLASVGVAFPDFLSHLVNLARTR